MGTQTAQSGNNAAKAKLCSLCGLCMVKKWPAQESAQGCVFTVGWLGGQESLLFGRERARDSSDEMLFGISRERFVARMKQPLPGTQFTGIITGIAQKAFESGLVDAVVTLHRSREDYFMPVPVLAQSTDEILAGGGSKPVLAQTLVSLEKACRLGLKRLLVIGASCHVQNLREFQRRFPYIRDMDLYTVGIPCTDNVHPKNFRFILSRISRSHETVRHYEFMQDFTIHLRHADGSLERVPFFCLPPEISSPEMLTPSCRSCFDYCNSLADITVGYCGAPLDTEKMYQWVLVRTGKGEQLQRLIADELEKYPETAEGDRTPYVHKYAQKFTGAGGQGRAEQASPAARMSIEDGMDMADYLYAAGPRGLEFVRYAVETHLIRNYYFVKENYQQQLATLVPQHVYRILEAYGLHP